MTALVLAAVQGTILISENMNLVFVESARSLPSRMRMKCISCIAITTKMEDSLITKRKKLRNSTKKWRIPV
jgi:hypothetical protein